MSSIMSQPENDRLIELRKNQTSMLAEYDRLNEEVQVRSKQLKRIEALHRHTVAARDRLARALEHLNEVVESEQFMWQEFDKQESNDDSRKVATG